MIHDSEDVDVDEVLREWGRHGRAQQNSIQLATSTRAPARRGIGARWAVFATAAMVLVVAIGFAVATHGPDRSTTDHMSSLPSMNTPPGVVHDGDTVQGVGTVVSGPSIGTLFCNDSIFRLYPQPGRTTDSHTSPCFTGANRVRADGVDLSALTSRKTVDGIVRGRAMLRGVYRAGVLHVRSQTAPPTGASYRYVQTRLPCTPARKSSLPATVRAQLAARKPAIERFADEHRATVPYAMVIGRDGNRSVVAYLLTTGDPDEIRAALGAKYGPSLCVARSRYTTAQIDAAKAALTGAVGQRAGATSASYGLGANGQYEIQQDIAYVTPDLARLMKKQAPGLIQLEAWLRPV